MSDPRDLEAPPTVMTVQDARMAAAVFGLQLHTQRIWLLLAHDPVLRSKTEQAILDGSLFMVWGKA